MRRPLRAALAAMLILFAIACGDGSTGPVNVRTLDSQTLTRDGLQWTASLAVMESFPVRLAGRIEIVNPGTETLTLTFANACTALLRAYRPQVPNAFLVWDQGDVASCGGAPAVLDVAPGGRVEIQAPVVSAAEILTGGKPNDEYGIGVYARANGRSVELSVGGVDLAAPDP